MKRITKIVYWGATLWLALGLFSTGVAQLLGMPGQGGADMMAKLGYPAYLMSLLGVWKILAVVALLVPKFPLLKEWAYAGIFFLMSGAVFSHIAVHDPAIESLPGLFLLGLTALSWYFRPESKKIASAESLSPSA